MSALQRNHVRLSGHGSQTLIFGHGFGCDQSAWRRVLPAVERRHRVVAYDLTGLGHSDKRMYDRTRYATLAGHAEDLLEICRELDLQGAVFVGHSVSAMIGALAAAREPARFRKLVLVAASPCYRNLDGYEGGLDERALEATMAALGRDYLAWCEHTVPIAADAPADDELTRELMGTFKKQDAAIAHHLARVIFEADVRDALPQVPQPCLILHAAHDAFVSESVARYLATHLPRAELKIVPGRGGHYPHLGAPDEVIHALQEFVAR